MARVYPSPEAPLSEHILAVARLVVCLLFETIQSRNHTVNSLTGLTIPQQAQRLSQQASRSSAHMLRLR